MHPQHGRVEMLPPATPTPCSYMTLPQYTDHVAMRKNQLGSACYHIPTNGHSMARTRTPQENEIYSYTDEKAIKIHN